MKIGVLANSRGRARFLSASLTSLDSLASGEHEVRYCVRLDDDDPESIAVMRDLKQENPAFDYLVGSRLDVLGRGANEAWKNLPWCDAYTIWHTASFPLTVGWDAVVANCAKAHPDNVFWWKSPTNTPTLCAFGREWLEARGAVYTEHFPFWFDDTWTVDLALFCHGQINMMPCGFSQRRTGKTHRLRDLAFWYAFFHLTLDIRIEESRAICAKLGRPFAPSLKMIEQRRAQNLGFIRQADQVAAHYGDTPPWPGDEQYFAAKRKAEQYLSDNGLRLAA